jgi:hypothetical protein
MGRGGGLLMLLILLMGVMLALSGVFMINSPRRTVVHESRHINHHHADAPRYEVQVIPSRRLAPRGRPSRAWSD